MERARPALRTLTALSRRRFLQWLGASAALSASGGVYARWIEPEWIEETHTQIRLSKTEPLAAPIRVLHLSDLHASDVVSLTYLDDAVSRGLRAKPDLIALTGDFSTGPFTRWAEYTPILAKLSRAATTFACLGNHDGGIWTRRVRPGGWQSTKLQAVLHDCGITLLHNRRHRVLVRDHSIEMIGVGDLWAGECEPAIAFHGERPLPAGAWRLVLNHNPDAKDLFPPYAWDLMLCGHTHGGQFRLPLIGTPFAPVRDKRFVEGLHAWAGRQIYITRGVGNVHGLRVNCRPEVTVLDLV